VLASWYPRTRQLALARS